MDDGERSYQVEQFLRDHPTVKLSFDDILKDASRWGQAQIDEQLYLTFFMLTSMLRVRPGMTKSEDEEVFFDFERPKKNKRRRVAA